MAPPMLRRALTLATILWPSVGCQASPDDLREWRPSDHRHNTPTEARQNQVPERPATEPQPGLDEVTLVTWRRNCTACHGQLGRGDGPQAAMTKPMDLTDPAWQARVTDEAIAEVIRRGRGRMPAFSLPDATVRSLVQLIRLLGGASRPAPPPAEAPSEPPSVSPE
jgi:mono/diheme cytochrome c family protein